MLVGIFLGYITVDITLVYISISLIYALVRYCVSSFSTTLIVWF